MNPPKLFSEIKNLGTGTYLLLLLAFIRSVGFFVVLPYLPVYLQSVHQFTPSQVGYVLGACLSLGALFSVYGGYLCDRFDKVNLMFTVSVLLMAMYFVLPKTDIRIVALILLFGIDLAASVLSISNNVLLSEIVPEELKSRVYSLRYTVQNIGAAVGPVVGVWANSFLKDAPFYIAAFSTFFIPVLLFLFRKSLSVQVINKEEVSGHADFLAVASLMVRDRRLFFFVLAGFFCMGIYAPLLTYLSQYLVAAESPTYAYQQVAYLSMVNAVVVITLQYFVGSKVSEERLFRWISAGLAAFCAGLLLMSVSSGLAVWVIAIVVFTIGEIIIAPAEFLCVDMIAPPDKRGSYFGAQNLMVAGSAVGPVLCGVILQHLHPSHMFYALCGLAFISWCFYRLGFKALAAKQPLPINAVSSNS